MELKRVRPHTSSGEPSYSNFNEQQIIGDIIDKLHVPGNYCVDIGAGDGRHMSNSYFLFRRGWCGLLAEADKEKFARLAYIHKDCINSVCINQKATPDNILFILEAAGAPLDFSFLTLDIDGYDYFVLKKIGEKFRPRLCCVEINEKIPPPIKFTVNYYPDYQWNKNFFFRHEHMYAGTVVF